MSRLGDVLNRVYASVDVMVDGKGAPVAWFYQWMSDVNEILKGLIQFIDADSNDELTADTIEQGLTNKIRTIVNREVAATNTAGQITKLNKRDPETGAVTGVRELEYNSAGVVTMRKDVDSVSTVTQSFNYGTNGEFESSIAQVIAGGIDFGASAL